MIGLTREFVEDLVVACVMRWLEYIGDVTDFATGRTVPETLD